MTKIASSNAATLPHGAGDEPRLQPDDEAVGAWLKEYQSDLEYYVAELLGSLGTGSASRAPDLIRGLPSLVRHLCANRPDVMVSTANNMSLITAIGLWLADAPAKLVLKTTNPIATSRHTGLVRWLRLATYRLSFRWTAAADLFVLPSDYEGLPAAVLEAMAVDCPVSSTDCLPAARSLVGGTPGCSGVASHLRARTGR